MLKLMFFPMEFGLEIEAGAFAQINIIAQFWVQFSFTVSNWGLKKESFQRQLMMETLKLQNNKLFDSIIIIIILRICHYIYFPFLFSSVFMVDRIEWNRMIGVFRSCLLYSLCSLSFTVYSGYKQHSSRENTWKPGGVVSPGYPRAQTHSGFRGVPDNNMLGENPFPEASLSPRSTLWFCSSSGRTRCCDTLPALRGVSVRTSSRLRLQIGPHPFSLTTTPPPPLHPTHPGPSSARGIVRRSRREREREREREGGRESAVLGCRSLGEWRTQRLRTQQ